MRSNERVGQLRIVGLAEPQRDIVEPLALDALAERADRLRHDVLGQHAARSGRRSATGGRYNSPGRRRCRRSTCPRGSRPAGPPSGTRRRCRAHPRRDRRRRRSARPAAAAPGRSTGSPAPARGRRRASQSTPPASERASLAERARRLLDTTTGFTAYSTSSTSTFSPVTRCDSAAAMKRSRSPSSTSDGEVEVTPVRRSFTS